MGLAIALAACHRRLARTWITGQDLTGAIGNMLPLEAWHGDSGRHGRMGAAPFPRLPRRGGDGSECLVRVGDDRPPRLNRYTRVWDPASRLSHTFDPTNGLATYVWNQASDL